MLQKNKHNYSDNPNDEESFAETESRIPSGLAIAIIGMLGILTIFAGLGVILYGLVKLFHFLITKLF